MIVRVDNIEKFKQELNKNKISEDFLDECQQSSVLFKNANRIDSLRGELHNILNFNKCLNAEDKKKKLLSLKTDLEELIKEIDEGLKSIENIK